MGIEAGTHAGREMETGHLGRKGERERKGERGGREREEERRCTSSVPLCVFFFCIRTFFELLSEVETTDRSSVSLLTRRQSSICKHNKVTMDENTNAFFNSNCKIGERPSKTKQKESDKKAKQRAKQAMCVV